MYEAKIENAAGEVLTLTGRENEYQILSIGGLNPPNGQINTAALAGLDGAVFNSSKLTMRNIVIRMRLNGNVHANRTRLYRFFQTKERCTFYYSNDEINVKIVGYVETFEVDLFTNGQTAQVSILCPFPYFQSIADIIADSSGVVPMFEFPFSIDVGSPVVLSELDISGKVAVYNPHAETSPKIEIDVLNGFDSFYLLNIITGEWFELDYSFDVGDKIVIETALGGKSVTLIRDGSVTNIFSALKRGSVFPVLREGMNVFEYKTDDTLNSGYAYMTFRFFENFRGV